MNRALSAVLVGMGVCILMAGCATTRLPAKFPVLGTTPDLQVEAVKSIKTIRVQRVAVMPLLEAPGMGDRTVTEGAGETVTAELVGQMALAGGWQVVPETDVTDALQKLPPVTAGNQQTTAVALGKKLTADVVLIGSVDKFKERVGVAYAAQSPASVEFTLQLVGVQSGQVVWTARFARSQKALTENAFNLMSFIKSEGRWVKAHEIAQEGIQEAVADLHEKLNLAHAELRFPGGSIEEYKGGILRAERKEATQ